MTFFKGMPFAECPSAHNNPVKGLHISSCCNLYTIFEFHSEYCFTRRPLFDYYLQWLYIGKLIIHEEIIYFYFSPWIILLQMCFEYILRTPCECLYRGKHKAKGKEQRAKSKSFFTQTSDF